MDGTDIVSKHNRSAGMMEDNTDAGFSPILRRRLMTVDRISGFLQGASMPLSPGLPDHDGPGGSALRGAGP